ncbi:MAG: hypothetical protein AAFP84_14165 [Actinomycetota bacterium]
MNKRIRTGLVAAAVTGGSILGLGQVGTVSAQTPDEPTDGADVEQPADDDERPERPGRRGKHLDPLAEILGMDVDALRDALREGTTLADVATDQGVAVETVVDAIVDARTERIESGVENGRITQEQADERLADLEERVTTRVNEGRPERDDGEGRGFRGPRGSRSEVPADADAES